MKRALLVTATELAGLSGARIVDCSHDLADPALGRRQYDEGHIPGAVHAHLDHDLSGPRDGRNGRHPLPSPAAFAAWLGAHGIAPGQPVVAYDRSGGMYAARLWWMLRWLSHGPASVLDGGWQAWREAGGPAQAQAPAFAPAAYPAPATQDRLHVDAAFVVANLESRRALLVDARGAGRFAGIGETIDPVAGHIPGARNRPYTDNLDADGRFRPADALRAQWLAVLDGTPADAVVAQCGSGVTACHNLFALELAGLPGARLYPGSWSQWCSDPARPVATGP